MPRIISGKIVVPIGDRRGPGDFSREGTGALPSGGSV